MSRIDVCDRCKNELHKKAYRTGMGARPPRFYGFTPTKSGAFDGWEISKNRIDLCQNCTAEFLIFAAPKSKPSGKSKK